MGRLPECTITLNDPNVSRRHAEIRPGNEIVIVDDGSTNGTKVRSKNSVPFSAWFEMYTICSGNRRGLTVLITAPIPEIA